MSKLTIQDLIDSLRKASANPESHAKAQKRCFSRLKSDSVLVNHGRACCVAGDLLLKAHQGESKDCINDIIGYCHRDIDPVAWVANELGLSDVEAILAFDANTHSEIHILLADLLEQGMRLPDNDAESIELSYNSTYTKFDCVYVGLYDEITTLGEMRSWMRRRAQYFSNSTDEF
jgi:hypothetical protein